MQKKPNNLKYFSLSKHLREESKSCQEFEVMLNNLNRIKKICKDAVVKYALCATKSKNEAALFLGISHKQLYYYLSTNDLIKKS